MSQLLLQYETIDAPQIDAIMEGRAPPPVGWGKPSDNGSDDDMSKPRPLTTIVVPAEQV